jgi:hypothetical protein
MKIVLIASWWGSHEEASRCLAQLRPLINDDIYILFFTEYAELVMGSVPLRLKESWESLNENYLDQWLVLEFLGRSANLEGQFQYIQNLTPEVKSSDWVKVAIIKSLNHEKATNFHFERMVEIIGNLDPRNRLDSTLLSILDKDPKFSLKTPEHILKQTIKILKKGEINTSLNNLDKLIEDGFIDRDIIFLWLSLSLSCPKGKLNFEKRFQYALSMVPEDFKLQSAVAACGLIYYWTEKDIEAAHALVARFHKSMHNVSEYKELMTFFTYIVRLFSVWQDTKNLYGKADNKTVLYVIGESHSLSLSNLNLEIDGDHFLATTQLVMGIQMNHLANPKSSHRAACVAEYVNKNPPNSSYLFTIGEIDSRHDEGIWKHCLKYDKSYKQAIISTVDGYLKFIWDITEKRKPNKIVIQGVPAPNNIDANFLGELETTFLEMIRFLNDYLRESAFRYGFCFLDTYTATKAENGKSNCKFHIDTVHLSPLFYSQIDSFISSPE